MKLILVFLALIFISGCGYDKRKDELIGIWVSDIERTEASMSIGAELPDDLKNFMSSNLGTMAYVFRPDVTTFTDISTLDEEQQYSAWEIASINSDHVKIKYKSSLWSSTIVEFSRIDHCLGLYNNDYRYTEYFCKTHNKHSQQDAANDAAPLL